MEKLTPIQEKELQAIIRYINYGKQFNSAKELYESFSHNKYTKWEDLREEWRQMNIRDYERRLNNIGLANGNSNTLRALEKKGYIELIKDGKDEYDIVKVIHFI